MVGNAAYHPARPDIVVTAVKPVFATLEQRLVIRKPGRLGATDQTAVQRAIREAIG